MKAGDKKVLQRYELKGGLPDMVLSEASINFLIGKKAKVLRIEGDLAHIEVRMSEKDIMMLRWPVEALVDCLWCAQGFDLSEDGETHWIDGAGDVPCEAKR